MPRSDVPHDDPAPPPPSARRWWWSLRRPLPAATLVDRLFFLVGTASAVFLAVLGSILGLRRPWDVGLLVPVWAVLAYLALPRLHRMLSDFYLPDYFFGRTRTTDGLLGDPVNIAVDGDAPQLSSALARAGWRTADELGAASVGRIVASTLLRRSYPTAPVSTLTLFGRRQDVAFQQEVAGNPRQRHHVRFWRTPPGWRLPGGRQVGWLGAATFDTHVGLSLFTLQVTHRIAENTDGERDHLVASVRGADPAVRVEDLPHFTTGYHGRNGGGDRFITDGNLPILHLEGTDADPGVAAAPAPPRSPAGALRGAPLTIVSGALLSLATTGTSLAWAFAHPAEFLAAEAGADVALQGAAVVGAVLFWAVQALLAWGTLRGRHRSRFVLMLLMTAGVVASAADYLTGAQRLVLNGTLLGATLQCLALIALTAESAAAWVRRGEPAAQASDA